MAADDRDDDVATPNTAVVRLQPRADAAAIARRFVHDNRDHLDSELVANAELLVSELVTNAVRHGAGAITLTVRVDPPGIGVTVTDAGDRLPVMPSARTPSDEPSGRGLMIVDVLSSAWGITHRPASGKTVWFDLLPDQ